MVTASSTLPFYNRKTQTFKLNTVHTDGKREIGLKRVILH